VSFIRDEQGRIKQITDPANNSMFYTYDLAGNLESYKDTEGNTTKYFYTSPSMMTGMEVTSADGTSTFKPINNEYVDGRLVRQLDASGKEILFTHDLANRRESIKDRLGFETVFEYDQEGNVVYQKDAEGGETRRTYDANGNVLTETTALGTVTNTYDGADNLIETKDQYDNITKYTYNGMRKVTSITDPKNNVTINEYHPTSGNLLSTKDAEGNETKYIYSITNGLLTSTSQISKDDPTNPRVTTYEYNQYGFLIKERDPAGNYTTYTPGPNGTHSSVSVTRKLPSGATETLTTSYEYDKLNRLVKTTYPDESFTTVKYNEIGNQVLSIDELGRETKYEYDEQGRLVKTIYADNKFDETKYDAEGRRIESKDRAGRITIFAYDKVGRLVETLYVDGGRTTTTYDGIGRVLTQNQWLDATNKQTTTYTYGAEGKKRIITIKDTLGNETKQVFNENGNLESVTDAKGHATSFEYDKNNRRVKTIYHDGSFEQTTYDGYGQVIAKRDQAGKLTQFRYDSLGRLIKVIDALNKETVYTYDEVGNQLTQTDANNHTTSYEYDKLGRRTKRTLPEGMHESYSYNTVGSLLSRTDFNGKTTSYEYDSLNRLTKKIPDATLSQGSIIFTYTATGRRETMQDASGLTTYSYDDRDRLISKATPQGTLTYTYDKLGNLKTVRSSNANGISIDYAYDSLNRLSTVTDNNLTTGNITNYTYDKVGNLESYQYGNGVKSLYSYNNLNRLTNLSISKTTTEIASYSYTLGAAGNRLAVAEKTGRHTAYSYDDLYRLTSETITNDPNSKNGMVSYTFDDVGNRLSRTSSLAGIPNQTFTYDKNDRLTTDTYDANGNTKVSNGNSYGYDFENRLTSQNTDLTIVYDGDGNRVGKTVNGITTKYLVDTNNLTGYAQVVEEIQGGAVQRRYTYGHDLISQTQVINSNWTTHFYGYDGHGSVRFLTNQSGNITDTYDYDAFGNIIHQTGNTPNDYLYAGEQRDSSLGLDYLRARYMNPFTGRFWSMDSYEGVTDDPRSLHKYMYTHTDPINNIDPSGQSPIGDVMVALAVFAIPTTIAATTNATRSFYNARNDLPINIVDQPVIIEGSDWTKEHTLLELHKVYG
jgi:RHS repeat-associated protein